MRPVRPSSLSARRPLGLSVFSRTLPCGAALVSIAALVGCNGLVMPASDDPNPPAPSASGLANTLAVPPPSPTPRPMPTAKPAPPKPTPAAPEGDGEEKVQASHILVSWKGAMRSAQTRTKDEAKKRIDEVIAKLKKGEDFGKLAAEYGEDGTKMRGGDLGPFARGDMVKPFADAAFGLKVGEVSGIVTTDFGYHVIKRTK